MDVLEQKNWTDDVTSRLKRFEKGIIIALKDKGWDGKESNETVTWTFPGGLFYSITVITTIGTYYFFSHFFLLFLVSLCIFFCLLLLSLVELIFRLWTYCTKNSMGKSCNHFLCHPWYSSNRALLVQHRRCNGQRF